MNRNLLYWALFLPNLLLSLPYALWALWSYLFGVEKELWWSISGITGIVLVAILKARGKDSLAFLTLIALSAFSLYTFSSIG
jgi:hypothetical protein